MTRNWIAPIWGSSLRPSCSLTASIDVGPVRSRCETTTGGGPPDLERRLPPPPPDCAHVVIGGHLPLFDRAGPRALATFHLWLCGGGMHGHFLRTFYPPA